LLSQTELAVVHSDGKKKIFFTFRNLTSKQNNIYIYIYEGLFATKSDFLFVFISRPLGPMNDPVPYLVYVAGLDLVSALQRQPLTIACGDFVICTKPGHTSQGLALPDMFRVSAWSSGSKSKAVYLRQVFDEKFVPNPENYEQNVSGVELQAMLDALLEFGPNLKWRQNAVDALFESWVPVHDQMPADKRAIKRWMLHIPSLVCADKWN